jgi:putative hydrolase of the HAD superfamily
VATRSGLLIDWGGVLTSDLFAAFAAFCEAEGLDPDDLKRLFREDPEAREALVAVETGRLDETAFAVLLGQALGVDADGLIDRIFSRVQPDEPMLEAVRRARRAGIRTGLVSNSWGGHRYPRELMDELFDGVVISGELGVRKPDPEIYAAGAASIDLPAEACVFVDDLPFNLKPAREAGMATVHHVSAGETIPQLEELLGVALR